MISGIQNSAGAISPGAETSGRPASTQEAARQFEALLLGQMLKSIREERGWLGTGDDQAGSSMLEMAEQQLAELMASKGGLGLAGLIAKELGEQLDGGVISLGNGEPGEHGIKQSF